jgi:hypothetical protein
MPGHIKLRIKMDKGPFDFLNNEYTAYLTVALATVGGGLVSYFDKMTTFSWKKLAISMLSSAFAGFIVALLAQAAGLSVPVVGAMAGVAAHMGTPAMIQLLMKNPAFKKFVGEEKE